MRVFYPKKTENRSLLGKLLYGGSTFFDLARWVIGLAVIILLITTFWMSIFLVSGVSMEPNVHDRELVLYQKNAYTGSRLPKRGEVVVVQYPGDPQNKRYVKRVIGLPGELIEIKSEQVYINSQILIESYLPADTLTDPNLQTTWQLDSKSYFLMGDNRPASNDSRFFGSVEKRFFLGRALRVIYPRFVAIQ